MRDVIVTGAGGFVGQALCRRLRQDGRGVLALARSDGDISRPALWAELPPAGVLIHLAGRSYVPDSWQQPGEFLAANVVGTQRALAWCKKSGARMIFASAYVYGISQRLPIREDDPARPNNPYALSKFLAEQCCEFAATYEGVAATILRVFNIFGPGQREEFLLPTLIRQLTTGQIRVNDLSPKRDYVYLDDVVEAFARALAIPEGYRCLNIGSGVSHSVADIIGVLQAVAGTSLPVVSTGAFRAQEIPDVRADISLAASVLGWRPTWSLEEGIRAMLAGV